MRTGEKSAEAVVAKKAGNSAGAKGRRIKEQSERSDSNRAVRSPESRAARSFPAGGTKGEQGQAGTVEPGWASPGGGEAEFGETHRRKQCTKI